MNQPVHIKDGVNYSGYNINGGETEDTNFEGTLEAFNALPEEEKAKYNTRDLIDDFNGTPIDEDLDSSSNHPVENQAIAKNIEAVVNVYGSKNLLPNNAVTEVKSGITYTVNNDGSVTANGTSNDTDALIIYNGTALPVQGCILSGFPTGSSSTTYGMGVIFEDNTEGRYYENTILPKNVKSITLIVFNGNNISNLTFYPMIRDSRITDPTYVPYAMTNRELTTRIGIKDCIIENNTNEQTFYYPAGMTLANCCLIGAKVYTKYGTWVDLSYDGSLTYWGKFRLLNGYFGFTPTSAGNAERIIFVFCRLY